MAEYYWPCEVLRARDVGLHLNERTLGTSPSVSGYTQVVSGGPPIWTATFASIDIRTEQQRLCWRALASFLRGRQNIIIVSLCRGDQPVPAGYFDEDLPHSDDTPHDDDTPYAQTVISAEIAANAAKGATSIKMNAAAIGDVQAGHIFDVDNRLYRIEGVTNNGGGNYTLNIWPPLIKPIMSGNWMEFDDPKCRMRLVSDSEMHVDFASRKFASPTVRFVQDLS
jgi:hypothetical protein